MQAENLPFADGEFDLASGDRGARARPRPRAHARRDGPLRGAPPARVGPPRAALAGCSTWRAAPTGATSATRRATSTTGRGARSSALLARHGEVAGDRARRSPGRCCLSASKATAAAGARASYGSGARILSIGIASTGRPDVRLLLDRQPRARRRQPAQAHLDVLWSVMFVIISVIYRPIEQLLSRTIADRRARGHARPPAARPDDDPGRLRAASSWRSRCACTTSSSTTCSTARQRAVLGARRRDARLRRQLFRPRLAGRAQVLRAVRRPRADGVDLADLLRDRGGRRAHQRPDGGRARDRRRAVRLAGRRAARRSRAAPRAGVAGATARGRRRAPSPRRGRCGARRARRPRASRRQPPTTTSRCAAAAASRSRCRGSCSPSRRC